MGRKELFMGCDASKERARKITEGKRDPSDLAPALFFWISADAVRRIKAKDLSTDQSGFRSWTFRQAKQAAERSQLRVLDSDSFKQLQLSVIFLVTCNPQSTPPTHL